MDEYVRGTLDEYEKVTPAGAMTEYKEFEGVCERYYARGGEFKQLLNDTLFGQMFDELLSNLNVEHQEKLPPIARSKPLYYDNVMAVFHGEYGELYPFIGLLSTLESEYQKAWIYEGVSADPLSGGGIWRNHYLEEWTELIEQAERDEESRLKAIKDYALKAYEIWSSPLLYEELGERKLIYANRCYDLLLTTFVEHNWEWAYEVFEMKVSEPEIVREWRENEN